jgi:hypothetical protein
VPTERPLPTDSNGPRRPDGRFGPSNGFGRGNPEHRRMKELRSALLASVDDATMAEVGATLAGLARGGDIDAIKVLLSYTIGKPPQAIALTGPEGESLGVDWPAIQGAVLGALAAFPEARLAVALKLKAVVDDARGTGAPGDGAGPESPDGGDGA